MENNFEKQVRQRLRSMRVDPSDRAWKAIEQRLPKKRRYPIAIPAFILAICLISATLWVWNFRYQKRQVTTVLKTADKMTMDKPQPQTPYINSPSATNPGDQFTGERVGGNKRNQDPNTICRGKNAINFQHSVTSSTGFEADKSPFVNTTTHTSIAHLPVEAASGLPDMYTSERNFVPMSPPNNLTLTHSIPFQAPATTHALALSIVMKTGISGFANRHGNPQSSMPVQSDPNATPGSPASPVGVTIRPSASFAAGIMLQKQISKSAAVSTGLMYNYSSVAMQAKMINNPPERHDFVKQFHFVELPLLLTLRLSRPDANLPLSWTGGLQFAQLVSTNSQQLPALAYFQPFEHLNKTQVSLNTGVQLSLLKNSRHSLQLGPWFNYHISNMATRGTYHKKHMYFVGLKAGILLK